MDYTTLQTIDRDIGLFVSIVRETLSQALVEEVCDDQMTVGQVRSLCFIWTHDQVTIGDISRGLSISYPAATKTISRLAEKGLVIRRPAPGDRRNIFVEITPQGAELTNKIKPEKLKRLGALLDKLDPVDLQHLLKGIEAFLTVALSNQELLQQICLHCGREHVDNCILSSMKCPKAEASGA